MRVDDYRYYSNLCLGFGLLLLIIGIILSLATMSWYNILGYTVYEIPYLGQGVALAVVGVILIVVSQILDREYRFKIIEQRQPKPTPPTPAITKKYCRFCGSENKKDSSYCEKCGKPLE